MKTLKLSTIEEPIHDHITETIQENADLGPTEVIRKLMKAVQQQAGMGDVVKPAKKLSDKPRMKQVKKKIYSPV